MSTPFYQTVSNIADQRLADQRLDLASFGDDLTAGLFDVDHADYTFEGCESQKSRRPTDATCGKCRSPAKCYGGGTHDNRRDGSIPNPKYKYECLNPLCQWRFLQPRDPNPDGTYDQQESKWTKPDEEGARSYRCSKCHLPKRNHVCLGAPLLDYCPTSAAKMTNRPPSAAMTLASLSDPFGAMVLPPYPTAPPPPPPPSVSSSDRSFT